MRTHSRDSSKETIDELDRGESSNGGTPICSICSMEFRSWKSVYGHMKSHPKRQRQGVMEPPGAGCAETGKQGRPEVPPEMSMDMLEAVEILLEIGGNSGMVARDPGDKSGPNDVVEGPGSDPEMGKMEDPDWDPSKDSDSVRFKCPRCRKAFASRKALVGHRLKHNREGSRRRQISSPGPVVGNGSAREAGQIEQIREEVGLVEPVRSNQQTRVGPTLSLDAQIPGTKPVIDLNLQGRA